MFTVPAKRADVKCPSRSALLRSSGERFSAVLTVAASVRNWFSLGSCRSTGLALRLHRSCLTLVPAFVSTCLPSSTFDLSYCGSLRQMDFGCVRSQPRCWSISACSLSETLSHVHICSLDAAMQRVRVCLLQIAICDSSQAADYYQCHADATPSRWTPRPLQLGSEPRGRLRLSCGLWRKTRTPCTPSVSRS